MARGANSRSRALRSRLVWALVPAMLVAAAVPAQAPASTAAVEGSTLTYVADAGESNRLSVEPLVDEREYRLSDDAAIRPGRGCRRAGPDVVCNGGGVALVVLDVGDRDDHADGPAAFLREPLRVEMRGGEGDDVLRSGIYADNLQDGGPGNDTLAAGDSGYVLRGGDGDDRLLTSVDGVGTLDGGGGNDYLEPQGTRESINGGTGLDTLSYRLDCCQPAGPATVSLDGVANDGHNGPAGDSDNVSSDIEVITGSPLGDSLRGDAGANFFHGADGADTLAGGAGDDYLYGEAGDDQLTGGAGNDQLDGGRGDDAVSGGEGADKLKGGRGKDILDGGAGDDVINARGDGSKSGPDTITCGAGTDTVRADRNDTITVASDCENVQKPGDKGKGKGKGKGPKAPKGPKS